MLTWEDEGIVLSIRPHGETGAVLSLLTAAHGRAAGYVYGATSARHAGVLQTGNLVAASWRSKSEGQLGTFTLELARSHAARALDDPYKLTAIQSACALADRVLPEGEPHAGVFGGLKALFNAFESEIWPAAYVGWEIGLLTELGFGLDLTSCASTGATEDLVYVSPRSGRAVSAAAGAAYHDRMLRLPPFLKGQGGLAPQDVLDGLRLTGHFLVHRVFAPVHANLPEPRLRLEEKWASICAPQEQAGAVILGS